MDTNNSNQFKPSMRQRFTSFVIQSKRVWLLLRKPSQQEFKTIATISALGILAIGAIGFVLSDVIKIFFK